MVSNTRIENTQTKGLFVITIEIIGYKGKADFLSDHIWAAIIGLHTAKKITWGDKAVVTIIDARTQDRHGRVYPFLRVHYSKTEELEQILSMLERMPDPFDVLCIAVDKFIKC